MRNECNRLVRKARARYIQEQTENYSNDPKAFWMNIRDVLPNSKVESSSFKLVDHTKKTLINDDETATFINKYFTEIGPKLAENLNDPWVPQGEESTVEITNIRVSTDKVLKVCKAIDISKSSAVDGLSSKILKDAFVAIVHKLTRLFNLSLTHGKFQCGYRYNIYKE